MKRKLQVLAIIIATFGISSAYAQTVDSTIAKSSCETKIEVNLDIYSSYVWRGIKFGNGAAFQPKFELTSGEFTLGAWGNINTNYEIGKNPEAFEADLYASYSFPFGVTLGLNDYYFGGNYLGVNFNNMARTHSIEPTIKYEYGDNLSFFGALMYMEGPTSDFYCEIAYDFDLFDFAIGAGEGQYTINPEYGTGGDFGICNLTVSKVKTIKISDKYSIPMKGAVTLNPTNERFYAYVGITL